MYTTKSEPNVRYGFTLWVIMTCHGRFTNYNTCTTLVGDVDNENKEGKKERRKAKRLARMWGRGRWHYEA